MMRVYVCVREKTKYARLYELECFLNSNELSMSVYRTH